MTNEVNAMPTGTEHVYIVHDDQILSGEPIIKGTRTPVRAVVETWRLGVAPEDIPTHLPHLTLAQIFDALSYSSDHQAEITAAIERNRIPEDRLHRKARP
jgi:uncharacterized protein (DUF433 family)